jgi:superfamily I DNA and/or RNA helicase
LARIVDEIEVILADNDLVGRSIGVVTLLGSAQAAHIQELVSNRISPVDVVTRKIAVGPPPVFQGKERDIMLVSMVLGPGDRSAQNRADQHQRFNVALSRARDRMYLFRSVRTNGVRRRHTERQANPPLKRQINRILGGETGLGRLQRDADWQIWRSGS